ncbi:SIT4 phosphatase-associated protein-domain-containing protein [Obelidium mucronatum]|nr:SIT4 phosphatase-associated protein-domain-containing protein [Obelidium mucronatum]
MFWRFGFHPASNVDALLEKEGVTLEELFEEEELLQECKSHNSKLIEFLCRPEILQQLLNTIITENPDETKKFKYPYLAAEIFGCEIYAVSDAVITQPNLLESFWTLLDSPAPIHPLQASYFSKVNGILMQKKAGDMVEFVKSQVKSIPNILVHVGNSSIAELLLKIISLEEIPEGQGIVLWLSQQGLIPSLVERLDPTLDIETHNTAAQTLLDIIAVSYQNVGPIEQEDGTPANAGGGNSLVDELKSEAMMRKIFGYMLDKSAPNASSSLSSGVIIMIELIRRYCSEIEQAEFQQHQFQTQLLQSSQAGDFGILPSTEKMKSLSVDLNDLLKVIGEKVEDFSILMEHPRNMQPADTTLGRITPLGSERLRTCELFAEILHLQYLYFSSPLFERLVFGDPPEEDEVAAIVDGGGGQKPERTSVANDAGAAASSAPATSSGGAVEGSATGEVEASAAAAAAGGMEGLSSGIEGISLVKKNDGDDGTARNVADELTLISELLVNSKVLPMCLSLFFQFPWNNFLHSVVYDMIAKVFNTYSFTSQSSNFAPVGPDGAEILPPPGQEGVLSPLEEKMKDVSVVFKKLVVSILVEGRLTVRITEAQRRNDFEVEQPKGVRLGYMGHLTYISDEVTKLVEKCLDDFGAEVVDLINSDDWQEYLSGVLKETKDRDRQALGGVRPTHTGQTAANFGKIDETDMPPLGAAPPPKKELGGGLHHSAPAPNNESDEEEDEVGKGSDSLTADGGDVASDQMARFICQSIVNDFPDRGLLGDESDEDEDEGLGEAIQDELLLDETGFDVDNPFPDKVSFVSFDDDSKADASSVDQSDVESMVSKEKSPAITPASEAGSPLHKAVLTADGSSDDGRAIDSGTAGVSTPSG